MLKIHYANPMTKTNQYEYAMYLAIASLFYEVETFSFLLETLKLYYMELTRTGRTGSTSFDRQHQLEEKMSFWVKRDLPGKIHFPMMHQCKCILTTREKKDGSHIFIFSDGIYGFSVSLRWEKGNIVGVDAEDLR